MPQVTQNASGQQPIISRRNLIFLKLRILQLIYSLLLRGSFERLGGKHKKDSCMFLDLNQSCYPVFHWGVGKARFASRCSHIGTLLPFFTMEIWLKLYCQRIMREYVAWPYSCIILHNMLPWLGDKWADLITDESSTSTCFFPIEEGNDASNFGNCLIFKDIEKIEVLN
ncbi:hypothetical protein VP01_4250g3 [Puccinia sorghi]|uniref:Uncharacterized protein n=1 Tax=Puccinia sorghi TaxID=27349 RepID=A0A0L6UR95_9BASI|nr:hypothetical protein VP01_4250g3 [Puccinia sorghi]